MGLLSKARPLASPTLRSLFINNPRTFTSHTQTIAACKLLSTTLQKSAGSLSHNKAITLNQIRFNTTNESPKVEAVTTADVSEDVSAPTKVELKLVEKGDQLDWITVSSNAAPDFMPVGALLPFSQLNFLQQLFFPYTYALMYYLDYLSGIMPWWSAIILTTATARSLFFPLVVKQNIIGIKVYNVLPETQKIQKQLNTAMASGDTYGRAIAQTKLKNLFEEHGISMKDRLLPVLVQAPLYMSFFFLLRKLTNYPVEGLKTGGILWFTDLTIPDPYFILPLLTSTSMFILLEFGLEGGANPAMMTPMMKYFMRAVPVIIFGVTYNFPAATLLFWSTSNLFTLTYAMIMKTAIFKKKFNLPVRKHFDPSQLPVSNMTLKGQVKEAKEKATASKTSLDVRRLDDIAFRKAGIGPLKKTYKEPPKTQG